MFSQKTCLYLLITRSSDILLVRMTTDAIRPPETRYRYSNVFSGLITIVKEEGIKGLRRGLEANGVLYPPSSQGLLVLTLFQTRAVLMNVSVFHLLDKLVTVNILTGFPSGIVCIYIS